MDIALAAAQNARANRQDRRAAELQEREMFERQRRDRGIEAAAERFGDVAYAPTVFGQAQGVEQRGVRFQNEQEDRDRELRQQAMRNALALSSRWQDNGVPPQQQAQRAADWLGRMGYDEGTIEQATAQIGSGEVPAAQALEALFGEEQRRAQYDDFMTVAGPDGEPMYVREVVQPDGSRMFVDTQGNPVDDFGVYQEGQEQYELFTDPRAPGVLFQRPVGGGRADVLNRPRATGADAEDEEVTQGAERLDTTIREAATLYTLLDQMNGVSNPDASAWSNLRSSALRAAPGADTVLAALGDEAGQLSNRIGALQADLVNGIRQATGMSARAMDSDRELQFYLQTATQPQRDVISNYGALYALDRKYGLGGAVEDIIPPERMTEVRRRAGEMMRRGEELSADAGDDGGEDLAARAAALDTDMAAVEATARRYNLTPAQVLDRLEQQ